MIATKNNKTELVTIFDYAKLSKTEKIKILSNCALFIEHFSDKKASVSVYFLNGFFIEVTEENNKVIDIIPYKRGYTLQTALTNKESVHYLQAA